MPRLLNVNSYHYRRGGSDVVYLEHAALMEAQGWENAFFSMHHPSNLPSAWSRFFVEEIEFGHSYSLGRKLSMAGKVVYSLEAQRKLRELLREFRPDVAHLHCIYHHLSPSILPTLSAAGVPIVMTAHDLKLACPAYKMLNSQGLCERCKTGSVLNVVLHRCIKDSLAASSIVAAESLLHGWLQTYQRNLARVIAPSRFIAAKLVEWGWPERLFEYIPNYVDADRFVPDSKPGRYFAYFGRMIRDKGVATLIRAAARAGVPLKLAGTGPDEEQFRQLAGSLGADCEFLGYCGGDALHDLVRGARACVLPSEIYENAPMSVLEAFALGKPVLGAEIGGIPELIDVGANGWRFASGDVDALTATLQECAAMPDAKLVTMGQACRQRVEREFSRERYLESMLGLYGSLGVRC